jgi:hypothetical protein
MPENDFSAKRSFDRTHFRRVHRKFDACGARTQLRPWSTEIAAS